MSKYNIIAIEREYASGGLEIGQKVAEKLGIPCYGREILEIAAKRYNTTPEQLEYMEETATNSLMYAMVMMARENILEPGNLSSGDALSLVESQIIHELAEKESCVFVGRCANWVLKEREDALKVFVYSDLKDRRERAVSTYGIAEKEVDGTIKKFDKRRSQYYYANSGADWRNRADYHLMLNSGLLGVENCANTIVECVK